MSRIIQMQKSALLGAGVLSGVIVHQFVQLLLSPKAKISEKAGVELKHTESTQMGDMESWILSATQGRKNLVVALGFFAMSAAAALGKMLISALREVEVTRINARTELDYQTHNWLSQDPALHGIVEQESVNQKLRTFQQRLEEDALFRQNPKAIQQEIGKILESIGHESAPLYYSMLPPISLVDARA